MAIYQLLFSSCYPTDRCWVGLCFCNSYECCSHFLACSCLFVQFVSVWPVYFFWWLSVVKCLVNSKPLFIGIESAAYISLLMTVNVKTRLWLSNVSYCISVLPGLSNPPALLPGWMTGGGRGVGAYSVRYVGFALCLLCLCLSIRLSANLNVSVTVSLQGVLSTYGVQLSLIRYK